MAKYLYNTTESDLTFVGKTVFAESFYLIQDTLIAKFTNDTELITSIVNGDILVAKDDSGDNNIIDINQALNYLKNLPSEVDQTGRQIIRYAATVKGWHYQVYSVQFEVNKLNSIYNKDCDGNDLGFCELKIYKSNGTECTTQGSADIDGVKTIITWKPDFDFEIISGNIRQLVKETVDSYIYVNAKVATGLEAPNDFFKVPFVQGGINLNYIGADEPLKTDGRASKLFSASTNGDYFEIIVNYESDLLTNDNRHKMSVIFEIYKDPTT